MKKLASIVLLASFCVILSGCIFSVGGGGGHKHKKPDIRQRDIDSDPVMAEIKAVRRLTLSSSRFNVYNAIAQRPGLSPKARAFLVDEATKHLILSSSREQLLMTLAKNPPPPPPPPPAPQPVSGCAVETKKYSDTSLAEIHAVRKLSSEAARYAVYQAIAKRPGLSVEARGCLAEEATKYLSSEASRTQLLLELAKNTAPPQPTKTSTNAKTN